MQRIDVFLNRHQGEPAWIFGKGPSLDDFDFNDAGPVRICVNESLLGVPDPLYFFAHDEGPIRNVADSWPKGCSAILQKVRGELAEAEGIPGEDVYMYEKCYADNRVRDMSAEEIATSAKLYGNSGTVHCAIHFCRLIGARHIMMVGFDGSGGYAKRIGIPTGGAAHERIRRDCVGLLEVMGIPSSFAGPALV